MATIFKSVIEIVPDCDRAYLREKIVSNLAHLGLANSEEDFEEIEVDKAVTSEVCQIILDDLLQNGYKTEKNQKRQRLSNSNGTDQSPAKRRNLPAGEDIPSTSQEIDGDEGENSYITEAIRLLGNEFRWFFLSSIEFALKLNNDNYLETRKFLLNLVKQFFDSEKINVASIDPCHPQYPQRLNAVITNKSKRPALAFKDNSFQLLKIARKVSPQPIAVSHPDLLSELESIRKELSKPGEPGLVCGCCFGETTAETLLPCIEGHIFCRDCMMGYVKTKTQDGVNKGFLECMESNCQAHFSRAILIARLPNNLVEKLDERIAASNVNQAGLNNLVRCPKCSAIYELDGRRKVLYCIECSFSSCRRCGQEWNEEHQGKKCEDVELHGETKKRRRLEEKMSQHLIRQCPKCKTPLLKNEGCNKLTCSCGATLCYVCRTPFVAYDHFCQHLLWPGKPCSHCKKCSLWIDPSAKDNGRIKELEEKAKVLRKEEKQTRLAKLDAPSSSVFTPNNDTLSTSEESEDAISDEESADEEPAPPPKGSGFLAGLASWFGF